MFEKERNHEITFVQSMYMTVSIIRMEEPGKSSKAM